MTARKPYLTLAAPILHEPEAIKGSRFIVAAAPIADEAAAKALLAERQAAIPEACHHCWALRLAAPRVDRSSDDGEPGGSAGRPMHAVLEGRELLDVAAVVSRIFGGTKLGVGGLMRAYGGSLAKALDRAELATVTPKRGLWIEYGYEDTSAIEAALRSFDLSPARCDYAEKVRALVAVPDTDWEALRAQLEEHSGGRVRLEDEA